MDQGVLQISRAKNDEDVLVVEPHFKLATPIEIFYQKMEHAQPKANHVSPVVICMPSPFPFKSTKVVLWRYDVTAIMGGKEECI